MAIVAYSFCCSRQASMRGHAARTSLGVGGEFLGEIGRHFRRRQGAQAIEVFRAKSGLDRDEALFEHAEIGRGEFELRLALRSSAEAREASRRVGSGLAQSLPQAGIKGRALEGR